VVAMDGASTVSDFYARANTAASRQSSTWAMRNLHRSHPPTLVMTPRRPPRASVEPMLPLSRLCPGKSRSNSMRANNTYHFWQHSALSADGTLIYFRLIHTLVSRVDVG